MDRKGTLSQAARSTWVRAPMQLPLNGALRIHGCAAQTARGMSPKTSPPTGQNEKGALSTGISPRLLEGLDEVASARSGSPLGCYSFGVFSRESRPGLACQRKDRSMTKDQATSRIAGVTLEDTLAIRAAVGRADREGRTCRLDARSPEWIGLIVAERLKLDLDDKNMYREHAIRIGKLMNIWTGTGVLVIEQRLDPNTQQLRKFVVPGKNWRLTELVTRQKALNRELRKVRRASGGSSRENIDWLG